MLKPKQLVPWPKQLALVRDSSMRPHVSPSSPPPPPPHPRISLCVGTAPIPVDRAAGRSKTPAERSVPTRRATAAWTMRRARPSRVHAKSTEATVGGESGAREGGNGGGEGGGGGGRSSGISAAAP
jgi:hypothetical protein